MRVLLVKTSSLGDLIHSFPALTDAVRAIPGIHFDWLVEENFTEVPGWHPAVKNAVPIGLRRCRTNWYKAWRQGEVYAFKQRLRATRYDLVLDAQGLIKSALPACVAIGPRAGLDRHSAREPLAALLYNNRYAVARDLHAIERVRRLMAQALGYPVPRTPAEYGLRFLTAHDAGVRRVVLLHGTAWPSKHWPEPYWAELARLATAEGFRVELPWGDPDDRLRAERIVQAAETGELLPPLSLTELAQTLACAHGVIGVDSGLAHLAAAIGVPAVTLYGPTRTKLTGAIGPLQQNLSADFTCAPCMRRRCDYRGHAHVEPACFEQLSPSLVWEILQRQMARAT